MSEISVRSDGPKKAPFDGCGVVYLPLKNGGRREITLPQPLEEVQRKGAEEVFRIAGIISSIHSHNTCSWVFNADEAALVLDCTQEELEVLRDTDILPTTEGTKSFWDTQTVLAHAILPNCVNLLKAE